MDRDRKGTGDEPSRGGPEPDSDEIAADQAAHQDRGQSLAEAGSEGQGEG